MDVRFDAGSEVHALGADIWAAMRMASSVALVLAIPFPAMSKAVPCSGVVMAQGTRPALSLSTRLYDQRKNGQRNASGGDEGHGTIPYPFFSPEGQRRERTHSPTPNLRPFGGVLYAISEGVQSGPSFLLLAFIFQKGRWLNMPRIVAYCGSNEGKKKNRQRGKALCVRMLLYFSKRGAKFPSRKKAVRTVCGQFCGQSRERGYIF